MEIVYVLVGLAVVAVVYFLFFKKGDETAALPPAQPAGRQLPEAAPPKKEPEKKREPDARPAARPAEKKPEARPQAEVAPEATAEAAPRSASAPSAQPAAKAPSAPPPAPSAAKPLAVARDVSGLRRGLAKARSDEGFFGKLKALFVGKKEIGPEISADIEEVLLASDVGVKTTEALLARVKEALQGRDLVDSTKVWDALRDEARRVLSIEGRTGAFALREKPTVILFVGVNGAGKTTTIGKLATKLTADGKRCVLAAGDTFRAAAVQQLVVWGERVGCHVVRGKDGADPGSVIFDAVKKAQESGADVVLADTAGRLHTKANLMTEMKKVIKTIGKSMETAPHEVWLVLDSTNGQNALAQAKEFRDALDVTGLVMTKLDGTAKGGVVVGICDELALPIRYVGLGERPDDLHPFSPDDFVEALLGGDTGADG